MPHGPRENRISAARATLSRGAILSRPFQCQPGPRARSFMAVYKTKRGARYYEIGKGPRGPLFSKRLSRAGGAASSARAHTATPGRSPRNLWLGLFSSLCPREIRPRTQTSNAALYARMLWAGTSLRWFNNFLPALFVPSFLARGAPRCLLGPRGESASAARSGIVIRGRCGCWLCRDC